MLLHFSLWDGGEVDFVEIDIKVYNGLSLDIYSRELDEIAVQVDHSLASTGYSEVHQVLVVIGVVYPSNNRLYLLQRLPTHTRGQLSFQLSFLC